jgi:CDP-diacylglycerol--glycerol-3-phosphate 3-phosphatidyltransferase
VADQVADAALYLPFALVAGLSAAWVVVTVVLAATAELTGLAALAAGSPRRFDGPMGKSDRAVAFGLLAVLVAFDVPSFWLHIVLALVLALLLRTIQNRLTAALR